MIFSFYSTATVKTAKANIFFCKNSKGQILINGKSMKDVFSNKIFAHKVITFPLYILNLFNSLKFMLDVFVKGGGEIAQITAISKAISKFVYFLCPQAKSKLLSNFKYFFNIKFKERKKSGLKKARKNTQYSKR